MADHLFVDVRHGLCNRLRTMASGAAIAAATGRQLVVVWVPDAHCEGRLSDILDHDGPVIDTDTEARALRAQSAVALSCMEGETGARPGQPVLAEPVAGDVYVRSADSLVSPHRDMAAEQRFLRALRPNAAVQSLIARVPRPAQVAAHIRMGTGPAFDHLPWEAPSNWPAARHAELTAWREKSNLRHFVARLDALVSDGRADSIFLAADLPETYATLADRYGARLRWLPRDLYDRSPRQLQYALADLLLLSAADLFLASTFSSFSDVAQRLARRNRPVEQSGTDF